MIISSDDYEFKFEYIKGKDNCISRTALRFVIEINSLEFVTSDKISHLDMLKKTFRSRFSGDMMYKVKQTPCITDDQDTIQFMKYFLHHRVKQNIIKDNKFEELIDITDLHTEFKDFEPLVGRENITPTQSDEGTAANEPDDETRYQFTV